MPGIFKNRVNVFAAVMVIGSAGSVPEILQRHNPWHDMVPFPNKESVLIVERAEKISGLDCSKILKALDHFEPEGKVGSDFSAWEPWESKELDEIQSCDDFPCDVKLDQLEVKTMKIASKASRLHKYEALVLARVQKFSETGEKSEYEFPGAIENLFLIFEKMGFKSELKSSSKPRQIYRTVSFGQGTKPIRQVLERTFSSSPDEALIQIRDAYTNHYFDGWGEWIDVQCHGTETQVIAALSLELDLLKKHDIFSIISRSKIRSAMEEAGGKYLDRVADMLKK